MKEAAQDRLKRLREQGRNGGRIGGLIGGKKRWGGKTKEEISEAMRELALRRRAK